MGKNVNMICLERGSKKGRGLQPCTITTSSRLCLNYVFAGVFQYGPGPIKHVLELKDCVKAMWYPRSRFSEIRSSKILLKGFLFSYASSSTLHPRR